MLSKKQQWLIDESLKVHTSIDDNLEEWLLKAKASYDNINDILISEFKSLEKEFSKGKISIEQLRARFSSLAFQAQQTTQEIGIELTNALPEKMAQYANYSYEEMNKILILGGFTQLPTFAIEFLSGFQYSAYDFQSSVFKSSIRLGNKLNKVLEEGLSKGWGIPQYTKALQAAVAFTNYEANRIARTEVSRVSNEGAKRSFKDYGVQKVEWLATLEKRTCSRCAALHGKKYRLGDEPSLPLHPHCRCTLVPLLDGM